jgi:hypothetical protein
MWWRLFEGAGLNVVFSDYLESEKVITCSEYHRPAEGNSDYRSVDAPRS